MVLVMVGGENQFQNQGFALGEGQIESDGQSQHTAASSDPIWNTACNTKMCSRAR